MSAMAEHDLDVLGRRAGAAVLAEAARTIDSRAALERLIVDAAATAPQPKLVVEPAADRVERDGPRWRLLATAAALVAVVGGFAWLIRDGAGTIDIVGPGPGDGTGAPFLGGASSPATDPSSSPPSSPGSTGPSSSVPSGSGPTTAGSAPPGTTAPPGTGAAPDATSPPGPRTLAAPALTAPTVDDVAALVPLTPPPADRTHRSEGEGSSEPALSQTWVRTDPSGVVTAIVNVTSDFRGVQIAPGSEALDLPGWASAARTPTCCGVVHLQLAAPNGVSASLWANGLGADDTLAIARSLSTEDDDHWRSPALETPVWTALERAWSAGYASRTLTTLDAEGDIDTELDVSRGVSVFDRMSQVLDLDAGVRLVHVAGDPAISGRDGVSSLVVVRADGTVVRLGSRDPAADLVATAESLIDVGAASWDAAGQRWPAGADGCLSLFC